MDKRPISRAGKHDKEIPQTHPTACPGLDELALYLRGESPRAATIQRHIKEEECPSCSAYLAFRRSSQSSADKVVESFLQAVEQDARANYASLRESLINLQNSDLSIDGKRYFSGDML